MCGRFVRYSSIHELVREFETEEPSFDLAPSYNVAPGQDVTVVKNNGARKLVLCRWGFIPSWSKDPKTGYKMINARADSVADKPSFRDSFKNNRILVPANGFYEWTRRGKEKVPVYIRLASKESFAFAGLLNIWTSPEGMPICTCAIITTEANRALSKIHDRMPVIVRRGYEGIWLNPGNNDRRALLNLLAPYDSEAIEYYEVSQLVNSPSNNSPECISPVGRQ